MIVRIWKGNVLNEKADDYKHLMEKIAIPDYTSIDGIKGYTFTTSKKRDYTEFMLITYWESIESIKKFAGNDYLKAKYYEEDKEYLLNFAEEVEQYEVFADNIISKN